MTSANEPAGGILDGWDDELDDWSPGPAVIRYPSKRCDTGGCVQAETDGASTVIWETAQPDIRVVTSTESWQALLQEVRDKERARIVAWLRDYGRRTGFGVMNVELLADMIQPGKLDDLAAGDE